MKKFTKATCPCKGFDWATIEQQLAQFVTDVGPVIADLATLFGNLSSSDTSADAACKLHELVSK
jgi:hypothetical protein